MTTSEYYEHILKDNFQKLEKISIDYGILEKVPEGEILMIKANFIWDDIGTWASMYRLKDKDSFGNILTGKVIPKETKNCLIYAEESLIATFGVEDLIIVQVEDKLLICAKDYAERLKELLKEISLE